MEEEERQGRQRQLYLTVLTVYPSTTPVTTTTITTTAQIASATISATNNSNSSPTTTTTTTEATTTTTTTTSTSTCPVGSCRSESYNYKWRKYTSAAARTIASINTLPSVYLAAAAICFLMRLAGASSDCPPFDEIEHGTISHIGENSTAVRFMCDTGFRIVGNSIIDCSVNGTWNGTAPQCQPGLKPEIKSKVCESLPTIPNGQVQQTGTDMGSKAIYVCIKGFRMMGDAERVCSSNSTWTGTQPECKRIVCKHPGTPQHGKATPADITDYPTGTTITYECVEGYNVEGSATTVCSEEGSWTTPVPICNVTYCPDPPNITHATPRYTSSRFGQPVTYECHEGYTSISTTTLICTASGIWSGSQFPCTEVITTTVSASRSTTVDFFTVTQNMSATSKQSPPPSPTTDPFPSQSTTLQLPSSSTSDNQGNISSSTNQLNASTSTSSTTQTTEPTDLPFSLHSGSNESKAVTTVDPILHVPTTTQNSIPSSVTSPSSQSSADESTSHKTEHLTSKTTATQTTNQSQTRQAAEATSESSSDDTTMALSTISKNSHQAASTKLSTSSENVNNNGLLSSSPTASAPSVSTPTPYAPVTKQTTTKFVSSTAAPVPVKLSSYMIGVKIGIIIGIVIGALLPIIFIIVCSVILCKRKRLSGAYQVRLSNRPKDETTIILEPTKPANHSNGHVIVNGQDNHVSVWGDEGYTSPLQTSNNTRLSQLKRGENHHEDVVKDPNWNDDTIVHIPTVHGSSPDRTGISHERENGTHERAHNKRGSHDGINGFHDRAHNNHGWLPGSRDKNDATSGSLDKDNQGDRNSPVSVQLSNLTAL